jgi:hypothetical protein
MVNDIGKNLYRIIIIILLLVFVFLFRNESPILETVGNYCSFFIILLGILFIWYWSINSNSNYFSKDLRLILVFWTITFFWMFFVPFIFFNYNYSISNFYDGIVQDYRYILFYFFAFILATSKMDFYYTKLFKVVGVFSLISGLFSFILSEKSFSAISAREGAWTIPYYLWWVLYSGTSYWFLKSFFERKTNIGYYLLFLYLVVSLFFLKRSGLINVLLLLVFAFVTNNESKRTFILLFMIVLAIIVIPIFFGDIFGLIFSRFFETANSLDDWDRNLEIDEFFEQVKDNEILTGFGVNNYLKMNYIGVEDNKLNSIHLGVYNIIYKGGVLYSLFMVALSVYIIKLWKYISINLEIKIGFIIGLIFILNLFYEGGWSYFPEHFFFLLPIFKAINLASIYKKK